MGVASVCTMKPEAFSLTYYVLLFTCVQINFHVCHNSHISYNMGEKKMIMSNTM